MDSYYIRMGTEPTKLLIEAKNYAEALGLADQLDDGINCAGYDPETGAMLIAAWGISSKPGDSR